MSTIDILYDRDMEVSRKSGFFESLLEGAVITTNLEKALAQYSQ